MRVEQYSSEVVSLEVTGRFGCACPGCVLECRLAEIYLNGVALFSEEFLRGAEMHVCSGAVSSVLAAVGNAGEGDASYAGSGHEHRGLCLGRIVTKHLSWGRLLAHADGGSTKRGSVTNSRSNKLEQKIRPKKYGRV